MRQLYGRDSEFIILNLDNHEKVGIFIEFSNSGRGDHVEARLMVQTTNYKGSS